MNFIGVTLTALIVALGIQTTTVSAGGDDNYGDPLTNQLGWWALTKGMRWLHTIVQPVEELLVPGGEPEDPDGGGTQTSSKNTILGQLLLWHLQVIQRK